MIPPGLPSSLLERRPDIAASERLVAQANAEIGVAKAAYFPTLTLAGSAGYASGSLANWFTLPARVWSVGPELAATLFDGGLRHAESDAAIASYDQSVATYRQTVLTAFQDVEDNLVAQRVLLREAQTEHQAVQDARESAAITLNQYQAGTVAFLAVAQVAHLHSSDTDCGHCQLCAVLHTVAPAAPPAAAVILVPLGVSASQAEPPVVAGQRQSRITIRPPPAAC